MTKNKYNYNRDNVLNVTYWQKYDGFKHKKK